MPRFKRFLEARSAWEDQHDGPSYVLVKFGYFAQARGRQLSWYEKAQRNLFLNDLYNQGIDWDNASSGDFDIKLAQKIRLDDAKKLFPGFAGRMSTELEEARSAWEDQQDDPVEEPGGFMSLGYGTHLSHARLDRIASESENEGIFISKVKRCIGGLTLLPDDLVNLRIHFSAFHRPMTLRNLDY